MIIWKFLFWERELSIQIVTNFVTTSRVTVASISFYSIALLVKNLLTLVGEADIKSCQNHNNSMNCTSCFHILVVKVSGVAWDFKLKMFRIGRWGRQWFSSCFVKGELGKILPSSSINYWKCILYLFFEVINFSKATF